MEVHHHKHPPVHGLREFIKEIGIIVIGILIALSAEQAVQTLHKWFDLRETRRALLAEVGDNAGSAQFALLEDQCLLSAYKQWADWAHGGRRPKLDADPTYLNLTSIVWDTSKTNAVEYMQLNERLGFARFYEAVDVFNRVAAGQREVALTMFTYTAVENLNGVQAQSLIGQINAGTRLIRYQLGNVPFIRRLAGKLGASIAMSDEERQTVTKFCHAVGTPSPKI